ncbi:MAG: ECF-type sigma factor [Planctomycetota bacterium]
MPADPEADDLTRALRAAGRGSEPDATLVRDRVVDELRRLAARAMAREDEGHTLQPTALVGEAWLKLFAGNPVEVEDRGHFMALAANAMRQVLVDHARAKRRVKRGGAWGRAVGLELDALAAGDGADDALDVDLLDLEDALVELAELSPRQARTVELRFFGGLDEDTIAGVLGVSTRTVRREWRFARAWLVKRIGA